MLDKTLFYRCFHYDTRELFHYAEHILTANGYTVQKSHDDAEPDWMVAAPPDDDAHNGICLVAHLDTIIRKDGVDLVFDGPIVRNRFGVLGADDRAGVYTILSTVLNSEHRPPIILTNHEESGGLGVKELCRVGNFDKWLTNRKIKFFIELDRANANDYVYYSHTLPTELANWVETYGFEEATGSYSDVADLTRFCRIPHVNLSIGYKNQHGKNEMLHVPDMLWTQAKLWHMLHDTAVPTHLLTDDEIDGPPFVASYSSFKHSKSTWYASMYDETDYYGKHTSLSRKQPHGEYQTLGWCYGCQEYGYNHQEWLVCQVCLDVEVDAINPPEVFDIPEEEEGGDAMAKYNAEWAAEWGASMAKRNVG